MRRSQATFVVFLISAIMHEVLVSTPFHMVRPWSFLGMLGQVPLAIITKYLSNRFPGSSIGNIIFWLTFCIIGQPMAILMYTADFQFRKQDVMSLGGMVAKQCISKWWGGKACSDEL